MTQISDKSYMSVSHVSRTLKSFVEKEIATCITPQEELGRIYKMTKKVKKSWKRLRKRIVVISH